VVLRRWHGWPLADIAQRLGTYEGTCTNWSEAHDARERQSER
jgi:DNA-directed RNA polymerase specialized sigma24 family protein